MTRLFFILAISIFISCKTRESEKTERKNSLPDIDVVFETGDQYRFEYEMNIFTKGDIVYVRKIKPHYYSGKVPESTWLVELDSQKVEVVKKFLKQAKEFVDDCSYSSTSIDSYQITIENDTTIQINGNCEWNGYDYFSLEQALFKENFLALEEKRESLKDSIISILDGDWEVCGLKKRMNRGDLITFERIDKFNDQAARKVIWSFSDDLSFKSNKTENIDLAYSEKYNLDVKYGSLNLTIDAGFYTYPNGNVIVKNQGVDLSIEDITKNVITIKYLGR